MGCIASVIACVGYRQLTWPTLKKALRETAKVNTMILFMIAGSYTFSQILQISGATSGFLRLLDSWEMTVTLTLVTMILILLFLGAFMDQVSMMLLTLPFFVPLAAASGIDMLLLLVVMLLAMEISLMTPPFGLLLFVMKGVAPKSISLMTVYAAAVPFILIEISVLVVIVIWPSVATYLPSLLK